MTDVRYTVTRTSTPSQPRTWLEQLEDTFQRVRNPMTREYGVGLLAAETGGSRAVFYRISATEWYRIFDDGSGDKVSNWDTGRSWSNLGPVTISGD